MSILTDRSKITKRQWIISGALILTGLAIGLFSSWIGSSWQRLLGITILVFGALTLWPILMDVLRYRLDPFEARHVFVLFFALYTLPWPILTYLSKQPSLSDVRPTGVETITHALLLSLLGLAFFYVGYHMRIGKALAQRLPLFAVASKGRLLLSMVFLLFVSLTLVGLFLGVIGGLQAYISAGYLGLYQLEQGLEYFAVGFNLLSTTLLLLYYVAHERRTHGLLLLFIILFVGISALLFVAGRRRYLLTLIFAMLIYRHYAVRRFSLKQVVLLGIISFTLMSLWGVLRAIPLEQILTERTWTALRQLSLADLFYAVTGRGEFSLSWLHLPEVMEEIANGDLHYLLGISYLQTPLIFVPRLLYPDRPPTLSEWYVSAYYPDIVAQGGGRGFFFLAEAYLNFSVVGIFLLMLLAGIVFRTAYSYLKATDYDPRVALVYAAFISWIPSALRIDFAVAFKGFVEFIFMVMLLVFLFSSRWRLRVRR